ncbi:hypothetical protein R1sor_023912 [Riccia sorocarpa]|uniref:Protein kinase domain-containing protein n=1 Tax=Riccia sorocarpa TaxID=122646 RepID=A0ABD3GQU1_9MARC
MDVDKKRIKVHPERFSLDELELLREEGSQNSFQSLGSGGFGSIYLARLPKRTDTRLTPSGLVTCEKVRLMFLHDLQFAHRIGFGTPFEVVDPAKKETVQYVEVAVKRLTQYSADQFSDLLNEALRLRNVWGSIHVVIVYGVVLSQKLQGPCIVMERVQGCSLNTFLRSNKPSSCSGREWLNWWKVKLELFRELILGVMFCHNRGVFHGDLKGENVLLDEFRIPKLVDFGFSCTRRNDRSYYRNFGGSMFWASPEIYDQSPSESQELQENPFPSDVYSLGMILVEMFLDGTVPDDLDENDLIFDKLSGVVPIPIEPPPDSEEWLVEVIGQVATIVEDCCRLREDRISLLDCLDKIEELCTSIFDLCCTSSPRSSNQIREDYGQDRVFCSSQLYQQTLEMFRKRFPKEGSLSVLRFLTSQWRQIVTEELDLVHEACNYDRTNILHFLVFDMRMDYNTYYEEDLMKPIHKLALAGKIEMIKVLLDASKTVIPEYMDEKHARDYVNATVNYPPRYVNVQTPLSYAVEGDQPDTVEFLLGRGGILQENYFIDLASLACAKRVPRVVRKLLELGYFTSDIHHHRLLEYICLAGDDDLFEVLKRRLMVRPSQMQGFASSRSELPNPPLHYLCRKGKLDMAKTLVQDMGADVNFVSPQGNTLLHVVAEARGNWEMAHLLIDNGTDLHKENNHGLTALDIATETGNVDLQIFLQQAAATTGSKAEIAQQTGESTGCKTEGESASSSQFQPVIENSSSEAVECTESDSVSDSRATVQISSLSQAVEEGDATKVSRILSLHSLKASLSDEAKLDLLKTCCERGHLAVLQVLHSHGANLHGNRGCPRTALPLRGIQTSGSAYFWAENVESPLHWAAKSQQIAIVRYLVEKGVKVNSDGFSSVSRYVKVNITEPLHHAARVQSEEMMKILLEAGANANARDYHNCTAMDPAIEFKNKRMVDILIEHGFDTSQRDRDNRRYMDILSDTF